MSAFKPSTPVPWEYEKRKDKSGPFPRNGHLIVNNGGERIAEFNFKHDAKFAVAACNAYPTLMEALEATRTDLSRLNGQVSREVWEELYGTVARLDAALKKARGEA